MKKLKQIVLSAWEVLEVIFVASITVFVIRTFLVQPFLVSGASMEPNFSNGNYLLVDEITYHLREPKRGEIIVFRYPLDKEVFFIKRIIGIPGERVVSRNGSIQIISDNQTITLNEPYLPSDDSENGNFDITLHANQYFAMGDNRAHSFDSRNWGAVDREDIIGIARIRIFPFSQFDVFEAPSYPVK
ncbi:MAG: signal peptidase I [Patescibacteria group bacterium]